MERKGAEWRCMVDRGPGIERKRSRDEGEKCIGEGGVERRSREEEESA